jgi:hypothetical protein
MSKTRMGKRVASLLLSLVMMLSLLPTTVYATGGTGETNDVIVEETNTSDDNTVGGTTGNPELTGEDEGGGANVSEGETATVATIGSATYESLDAAITAVADGETIVVNAGEYTLNGSLNYTGKAFTIAAADGADVSFDMSAAVALHGAKITFNNVTFDYKTNGNYIGLQHADTLVYNNCTINGVVFLYAVNETFNSCKFYQDSADAYNVWTYGAQNVAFNGCTFNCVGKAVLVYNEGAIDKTDLTVKDTKFIASAPVEDKAAIEIDTSLMEGGATITVDDKTTAAGFDNGSNSGNPLWNDKKQTADTNKNTTVTVAGEKVFEPKATASAVATTKDGREYATLTEALAAVTESNPLTSVTEEAWPAATPVYYNGSFYATIGELLYDAQQNTGAITPENAPDTAVIYCRPGTTIPTGKASHPSFVTSTTIYGNGATLSGVTEWDVENYYTLTKDITINLYSLNGGASVWGTRRSDYAVTVNMVDCKDAHEVLFNYGSGNGRVIVTVKDSTFLKSGGAAHGWPVSINCLGSLLVDGCTFDGVTTGVVVNVKQPSENGAMAVTVKNSTFKNVTGQDSNKGALRVTGQQACDIDLTIENVAFTGTHADPEDITIGNVKSEENLGKVSYNISGTDASMTTHKAGATEAAKETLVSGTTYTGTNAATAAGDGTEANPYTLAQLGAMTRQEYIDAQKRLNGTMYVTVGDYTYGTNGVLGNGVRDDTTGQIPDHSKLNAYGENGYLGEKNDGANGKSVVFVGGSITSGVTGYTSIDKIGTSLLLALPAYTNVTFKGITFNNVMSFNYQLYTSPWSQLGALKFDGCTFNGIIVGAIAAQTLTFNGCEFKNYTNTTDANSSNPTWIRPAYGNWTQGDNEGQGSDFKSLTTINFTNNKVTSTRPVKFEYISQWDITSTVTATGNSFDISKQDGDTTIKNVGLYLGAHTDANAFNLVAENNTKSENTAALYTIPEGKTSLPLGSTVKNLAGDPVELTDALKWKAGDATTDKLTLKSVPLDTSIDLDTFIKAVVAAGYTYDGEGVTVKWSPVSGCYDTRDGHECTVENAKATGNTPKRVNNGLTQFQLFEGENVNVTVKNVKFEYVPAAFTVCENSNWKGSFTAEQAPAGQLYFMTTGDVNFEGCTFDKVVLTSFNTTGTTTVKDCQFKNVYNNYAIKDIRGANISVSGTTITNCGGGIMVSSTGAVSAVTITGNTFDKVDVAGTAVGEKVGTRALIQIASSGDYSGTSFDLKANTATGCGPVLRQLNQTVVDSGKIDEVKSDVASLVNNGTTGLGTTDSLLEQSAPAGYVEDEQGNVTISDEAGLFWFAKQANAGNNFAGKTVTLANNIALTKAWTPIGIYNNSKTHFKGTFDGQNHTVSGVEVTENRANGVGFFGKVYTGTIKNLTVEGTITTTGCNYVGGIVGHGYATISNCTFKGNVGSTNTMQVGGIAGSGGFTITNCSVYGNVTAECWAGGIVGNCQDGGAYTNCYVEGVISAGRTYWGGGAAGITPVPLYPSQVISSCYSNTVVKVAGEEVNCPIIAAYNNPLDYNGYTGDLKIYDNSWNKQKNSNDNYPIYAEKDGTGGVLVEGKDVSRDNNLVMLEDDLQYVTDLSKVRIMAGSAVTQAQVDALAAASIGTAKYITLAAAIAAANNGETVTLLKDVTEDVTIDKNITLDLGGKTLTNTGAGKATVTIAKGATATVQNGSIIGGTSYYNIQNNGTATFTGVTATAGNNDSSMIDNFGTLTIESGDYKDGMNVVKSEEGSTLTINGGKFTGTYAKGWSYNGVILSAGTTIITDGEFIQKATTPARSYPSVILAMQVEGYTSTITITGGKFTNEKSDGNIFYGWGKASSDNFEVSGGTFNKSISDDYCADGFIPTKNADGTYGVKAGKYVAQIGSKKYETLADAIRLAAKGKTITLLDNVTENVEIKANKDLTLDLNGFTLNGGTGTAKAALYNLGTITIQDTSAAKTGTIKRDDNGTVGETSYYVIRNQGTMTIESGIVINNSGYRKANSTGSMVGSSLICNGDCDEGGTLTIKGGTFTQNNFIAIKNGALGVLHVTGGTITSNHSAIQNWFKADITGGEIKGQLWTDAWKEGESVGETKIGGDAKFSGEIVMDITGSVAPTLAINGGNLNVTNWRITNAAANAGAKPAVSGGTFTSAVKEEYCATGYIPKDNGDGTYGVKEGVYVAKVDNVKYETLQAAIDAAKGGSTVRLLANVTLTETAVFPAGKTVHLNLVGHSITATGTALRINGTTDIQSTGGVGTIESTGNVAVAVGDNASLTVYSGTLKGREGAVITGTSTGAKIEIKKNATLIATDNAVIAGNGSKRDGKPNTILVRGGTFIGGIVTEGYIACGIYAPWNDNVTVSGGTFNITNGAGIVARAGTVTVTGGTFSCTGTAEGYVGDSKNKVPCAALVFDKAANYPALTADSKILVSGGSFSTDPAANGATLAAGYVAAKDESGMYKVAKANPTAEINGVKYDTLQAAINAAQATKGGATITLLKNINTESYYMVNGDNPVTIDLAGYNITGSGISGLFYVTAKGDLTIKGKGTVTAVEDNGAAMAVWVRSPIAKVTLEGGTYTQQITNTADPHFDLIYVERGNVYVKGGTYKGATPDWTLNCYDEHYQSKEANIEVTGGTFVGFDPANNKAEGENTNFVPAGYVSTKGADGNFVVTEVKVAEVNGVAYATLSEAIAAAKDGDTVKLLRDINTPEISYMISKSLTIDLNGMTVTGSGYDAVFQIDNADAKVIIKNGKVVAVEQSGSAGKYTMAIWASKAGCEVTLEGLDVSQKITHTDDPQMDMIYASGGTITINSGNFVSGTPAWTLNCNDTSYKNGTAKIIVKGGTFVGFDPANNKAEGENTSFVAAGYVSRMDEDGSYTVVPEDAKITVNKSLTLGNTLTMTYKVLLPEGYTSEKMVFEFYNDDIKGYDTVEVLNGNYNNTTKRYEFAFTGINPQRMNDTLKAKMYAKDANGNEVIYSVDDYSVAMYCNALLSSEANKDGKYTKLIASLVAYGTASQKYMNYRTDTLVSSIVDAGAADDYTAQLAAVQAVNNRIPGTGVTIKAKSLVLTNAFAIRVKFVLDSNVSIDDVYFTVNSDSTQYKEFKQSTLSDGTVCYYFDYTGLNASELDDAFTFTAHTGTGTGDALAYNANTYLNGMYKVLTDRGDTTSALYEIVTALFNYGWACDHF